MSDETTLPKAVVLGLGVNGLALARSLALRGVEVVGIYVSRCELGRHSRRCNAVSLPNSEFDEAQFVSQLIARFGNKENPPVLIGESDHYVWLMSRNKERLTGYFRFLVPELVSLESVIQKKHSILTAADKGLRTPETIFINDEADIKPALANISYPCLLKPDSCYVELGAKNLFFENPAFLESFLKNHPALLGHVLLQAVIPGGDANTYQATTYVTTDGTMLPIFTMKKIRQYPPDFGVTSFGLSTIVSEIAEETRMFLSKIDYRGLASIEFKKSPDDGKFYFIELNPRLPMYHSLILASGINYPFCYYQDVTGLEVDSRSVPPQKNRVYWLNFGADLGGFSQRYTKGEVKYIDWLFSLFHSRAFAYWQVDDPKPFWFAMVRFAREKIGFLATQRHS